MNIESKKWHVVSQHGILSLTRKSDKQAACPSGDINESKVTNGSEAAFDKYCEQAFTSGRWPQ